jgi:DNA-binding winged helix-turn-helix (wHTH) protein/tetratricopeptide (TPR) repeat protein
MNKSEDNSYHFGPFTVDPREHTLRRDGEPVPLPPKAFDTLLVLLQNNGRLVTKEELMGRLWPDTFVEESNLTVHISALRKAFGEHSFVETVPKRGYRFQASLIVRERTRVIIEEEEYEDDEAGDALAVLPFKLLSSDIETEYLGLGLADALITRLSSVHHGIVRPTSAVSRLTSLDQDPAEVCRKLKVKALLEGSVRREGDRLRLRMQLLRAGDCRTPLWAEQFDEEFTSILAVEDAICERVAGALMLKLTGDERKQLVRHRTENIEAYHHYLKGVYHANKWTLPDVHKALEHYQTAIECDQSYALAYAGIADAYCALSHFYVDPNEAMPQARAAAERALEIDDSLPEAHLALGLVEMWYERNWAEAERRFKRAIELNEGFAAAYQWDGYLMVALGRFEEGIAKQKRAHDLDPLSHLIALMIGWSYYFERRYDEAVTQFESLVELEPALYLGYWGLGWTFDRMGEHENAIAHFQTALRLSDRGTESLAGLGHTYAVMGRKKEAEELLAELEMRGRQKYISPFYRALIYAGLGESDLSQREKTIEYLERACDERFEWLTHLKVDPPFDYLRADPKYLDLLKRLGLDVSEARP